MNRVIKDMGILIITIIIYFALKFILPEYINVFEPGKLLIIKFMKYVVYYFCGYFLSNFLYFICENRIVRVINIASVLMFVGLMCVMLYSYFFEPSLRVYFVNINPIIFMVLGVCSKKKRRKHE